MNVKILTFHRALDYGSTYAPYHNRERGGI